MSNITNKQSSKIGGDNIFDRIKNSKLPKPELLDRLSHGRQAKIEKKDMLALTTKNYNLLPEIMRKKKEANKKDFIKERAKKVKEMDMVIFCFFLIIRKEGLSF